MFLADTSARLLPTSEHEMTETFQEFRSLYFWYIRTLALKKMWSSIRACSNILVKFASRSFGRGKKITGASIWIEQQSLTNKIWFYSNTHIHIISKVTQKFCSAIVRKKRTPSHSINNIVTPSRKTKSTIILFLCTFPESPCNLCPIFTPKIFILVCFPLVSGLETFT